MRQYHYWIVAVEPTTGKNILIYGCPDRDGESGARSKGMEMLGSLDFDIKRYPTSRLQEASAIWRGKRLQRGDGLSASTQRQAHEKTVSRWRQRREERGM